MPKLIEILSDFELLLTDIKIDSMFADLIEHTSKADDYDDFTRNMARSRTVSFICDRVVDLESHYLKLNHYHSLNKSDDEVCCSCCSS